MNPMNTRWTSLAFAATLLAAASPALAAPRFPTPPLPERAYVLHRESFDELYRCRMTNALLSVPGLGELRESWSGYALQRAGDSLSPFVVAGSDAEGKPLIAPASGAVRFWFRTYWASPSKGAPVSGPGAVARLVEMAAVASDGEAVTCWSLDAAPDGSALILSVQDNNGCREVLQARLNWRSGESHLVTLNYGPEASALYLDDQLAAEGKGVTPLPVEAAGMVVGSALDGRNTAQGEVEELFFLGRPVDAEQVRFYYGGTWKQAFVGPVGTREEERAKQELLALEVELLAFESGSFMWLDGREDFDGPQDFDDPLVYSDGSLYLEITGITNNVAHLIIHGTVPDTTYELLSKTDLTNSTWLSEGLVLGAVDQTNTPAEINIGSRTNQLFIWARTWADGDGNGLPDWWELQYLGQTGQDPYGDPDHDGWSTIQEYQNGTHPNDPNPPPPARNVVARVASTGTNVTLTWESGGAAAASYEIRDQFDNLLQTVNGSTFSTTVPMEIFPTLFDSRFRQFYSVRAIFTTPIAATADSAFVGIAPTDLAADVWIVRGSQGRRYLIVSSAPSELDHILLEWDVPGDTRAQMVIPATNLINGIVEIPSEVVATTWNVWYQLFNATGAFGYAGECSAGTAIGYEHSYWANYPMGYADVRPQIKENLKFLLRSATITRPFSYAANRTTYGDWLLDAYPPDMWEPEYYFARPPSPTAYEYSGFRFFSSNLNYSVLQDLRPLHENFFWRNFMVDAADRAATNFPAGPDYYLGWEPTTRVLVYPDYFYSGSGQELPLPLPLINSTPSFLYYRWFNYGNYDFTAASDVGVVLNTVGTTNLMLQTGVSNCYGLSLVSLLNSYNEIALPGDPLLGWWDMQYYANFANPVLETVDYYFASQTPFFRYNWAYGTPRPPMPGSPDFTVTNTSPLMIASFAQPMTIAGWARQRIVNGYEGKFGYLEQLFDHAVCLGPNGQPTANSAGTLSPYGEFFPTMSGPAALVTMPDEYNQRGTGIVHVIKLQLDVNHDGEMDLSFAGPDNTSQSRPFLFWINDNHDFGEDTGDGIPGQPPIKADGTREAYYGDTPYNIQGVRDLIDYFPLYANLGGLFQTNPHGPSISPSDPDYRFRLKQADGALRFVCTTLTPTNYMDYLRNTNTARSLRSALLTTVTSSGVDLPASFLSGIATNNGGIIIVEAWKPTTAPLVLEVWRGTNLLAQTSAYLSIDGVEQMFRHKNLVHDAFPNALGSGAPADRLTDASVPNEPETEEKNFLFLHGYNVNPNQARGAFADTFKRLYWSGSHARFYGVTWFGNDTQGGLHIPGTGGITPNYHTNVYHAFQTAQYLANFLATLTNGPTTVAAHSLGNMVVLGALSDWNARMSNYFMIDAAVSIEAVQGNAPQTVDMIYSDWIPYANRLYSHEWHSLFPPSDGRSMLTWQNRVGDFHDTDVYNFYSSGEEVLRNYTGDPPAGFLSSLPETIWAAIQGASGSWVWVWQEKAKGRAASDNFVGSTHGGWKFNYYPPYLYVTNGFPAFMTPAQASQIPDSQLATNAFFDLSSSNFTADVALYGPSGSNYAQANRDRILSDAIPAMTLPVGANPVPRLQSIGRNFDLNDPGFRNGWPLTRISDNARWHHSDFREVGYTFTYRLFDQIANQGNLR